MWSFMENGFCRIIECSRFRCLWNCVLFSVAFGSEAPTSACGEHRRSIKISIQHPHTDISRFRLLDMLNTVWDSVRVSGRWEHVCCQRPSPRRTLDEYPEILSVKENRNVSVEWNILPFNNWLDGRNSHSWVKSLYANCSLLWLLEAAVLFCCCLTFQSVCDCFSCWSCWHLCSLLEHSDSHFGFGRLQCLSSSCRLCSHCPTCQPIAYRQQFIRWLKSLQHYQIWTV